MPSHSLIAFTLSTFLVLFSWQLGTASAQRPPRCPPSRCQIDACNTFRVLERTRTLLLRAPDIGLGPFPCVVKRNGRFVELVNVKSGEPRVIKQFTAGNVQRISKWRPAGLQQPFSPTYFKFYPNVLTDKLGIGREVSLANQGMFVDDLCVELPITEYQIRRRDGTMQTVTAGRRPHCIQFRTKAPRLLLEFGWDTGDDFDIKVTEPNGVVIDRFNLEAPSGGRLIRDNASTACDAISSTEDVRYDDDANIQDGLYTIEATNRRECGQTSNWTFRVVLDGRIIFETNGKWRPGDDNIALRAKFVALPSCTA